MRISFRILGLALTLGLAACAAQQQGPVQPPQPVSPQPTATQLNPGLKPLYFLGDLEHVNNMPRNEAELSRGRPGQPILQLNFEGTGVMWESQVAQNYSIHMTGLIQMEAGVYKFAAVSNDGVRVTLDKSRVVDDPYVHATQQSPATEVHIAQAGWYPITVQYFQKRGLSALRLLWQPPGAGGLMPVPAAALAHRP
jgi:hypothetical protein